jgi:Sec-independent protein secretion pathway component TatC
MPPRDESHIEASRAPLMDHLIELRKRLIVCVGALIVGFGVCFAFAFGNPFSSRKATSSLNVAAFLGNSIPKV